MQIIKNQSHPIAWALYRLPYTNHPTLIMQTEGTVEILSSYTALNEKEGFVIAPFEINSQKPVVLIHPNQTAKGWEEIEKYSFQQNFSLSKLTFDRTLYPEKEDPFVYKRAFYHFIKALRKKQFHKLVLSRRSIMPTPSDFSPLETFKKACQRYPHLMVYQCYTPKTGMWMGSSPEIILSGKETQWHTVSLAGTMPINNHELPHIWSHKNSMEQQYVSDYLRSILQSIGTITKEEGPYPAQAGKLAHLKTDFYFTLSSSKHIGDLLSILHPTPAICGLPKEKAYQFILEEEGYPRHYYGGFIGKISPSSYTDLYVNLRCMELTGEKTVLYAGGGILAESEYESEYKESKAKMETMKSILYSSSS